MRAAVLVLALLLAGCLAPPPPAPVPAPPLPPAPAHEHAAFAMFIHEERVRFDHPDYDLNATGFPRAHLRTAEPRGEHVIHLEGDFPGGVPDVNLSAFLGSLGVRFAPGSLTLDLRDGHNGSAWNDTRAARWQVWVQQGSAGSASGAQTVPLGPAHVLRGGQRVLVTYAPPGSPVAGQLLGIPEPPP